MKIIVTVLVLLLSNFSLFATWSIIIIDPQTKEIGIAGASCTRDCSGIGRIIHGQGAIIVQAMSNNNARQKGIDMILSGYPPQQIIEALKDQSFDPEQQQYAIVTLKDSYNPGTYTGNLTHEARGTITGEGFSIQGNTLTSENVLAQVHNALLEGKKKGHRIDEILMAALEAGSKAGGDRRCGEQTASSAFMTVARPGDKKPYLDLLIFGQGKSKQNAVTMLRNKYNRWISRNLNR